MQHGNARGAQLGSTTAIHARVRVAYGVNHAHDAGGDERIGTRRRAAMMAARFKRDVSRRTAGGTTCLAQREDFGMRFTGTRVEAPTDHHAIANDDAAHARIRCRGIKRAARLGNGLAHETGVFGAGSASCSRQHPHLSHWLAHWPLTCAYSA